MICSQTRIRQLSVADEETQAPGVEIGFVDWGNAVDDAGHTNRVVRPAPLFAIDRDAHLHGAVDVGKIPWLDVAVGPTGAREQADGLGNLLLEIDAYAGSTLIDAHRRQRVAGIQTSRLREVKRTLKTSRIAAAEKAGDLKLAGLPPQLVPLLNLPDQLELVEGRVKTVGRRVTRTTGRVLPTGRRRRRAT